MNDTTNKSLMLSIVFLGTAWTDSWHSYSEILTILLQWVSKQVYITTTYCTKTNINTGLPDDVKSDAKYIIALKN